MSAEKIINDTIHSVMNHRAMELEKLIGSRFRYIGDIAESLKEKVNIIQSESERLDGLDFMLDGEYEDETPFTLYYLKDNDGLFYITEVTF